MYTPGNILYFTPFYFPNGQSPCKNKYFVVLKEEGDTVLVAGSATSKDYVPSFANKVHGCINDDTINFNCYYFEKDRTITLNNWGFPDHTYLYGYSLENFNRKIFENIYKIENVEYTIIGQLSDLEFESLKECMKNSKSVRRGIRRSLGSTI